MEKRVRNEPSSANPVVGGFVARLSGYVANGLLYWEPLRLWYNGVLAIVVLAHLFLAWPGAREKLSIDLVLGLFFLAVLANVCYCAAFGRVRLV